MLNSAFSVLKGSNVRCRYCLQQYERTYEAIRHVLNAHPQQNVSILLEKSLHSEDIQLKGRNS